MNIFDEIESCPDCDELTEDCNCENEDSVAEGLGFYIDDDGHWIPIDEIQKRSIWDDSFWNDEDDED